MRFSALSDHFAHSVSHRYGIASALAATRIDHIAAAARTMGSAGAFAAATRAINSADHIAAATRAISSADHIAAATRAMNPSAVARDIAAATRAMNPSGVDIAAAIRAMNSSAALRATDIAEAARAMFPSDGLVDVDDGDGEMESDANADVLLEGTSDSNPVDLAEAVEGEIVHPEAEDEALSPARSKGSPSLRRALHVLSWMELLLPSRLVAEDLGDVLEKLHRPEVREGPAWRIYVVTCASVFWLLVSAFHHIKQGLIDKKTGS